VPLLRARQSEAQRTTRDLFAATIAGRGDTTPYEREVLAAVALTTLTAAIDAWVAGDGHGSLPDLIDRGFAALDH
jgi:hypothetical protein